MNTSSPVPCTITPRRTRAVFALLFFGAILSSFTLAAETASDEPKPYTLYMGTDFAVQQGKDFLPVRDVKGKAFVVRTKKGDVLVPMIAGKVNLKIEQTLRVASNIATVTNLKTERAYTPARDPVRQFNQSTGGGLADAAALDMAVYEQVSAQTSLNNLQSNPMTPPAVIQRAATRLDTATASQTQASHTANFSNMNNTGEKAFGLQQALADELYDAMEVSFEVSSPEYWDSPYVVVVVRYHEKDATSRASANWIYAKAVSPIAAGVEKIHFLQGGLPEGFIIEECQVRLYNRGKEIATNVSPKRVALSEEDAFEFLKVKHISSNRAASVSAAPALPGLNAETKTKLTQAQQELTYFVTVSPEGIALAAFTDEACSIPVDATVGEILANVRFYPELKLGKPVAGVSRVVLSQLSF
jgi:hypothetical protein